MADTRFSSVCVAGVVAALMAFAMASPSARAENEDVRPTMQELFEALAYLVPMSLEPNGFESAENSEEVAKRIESLARATAGLGAHGGQRDPAFDHLRATLERDVVAIESSYHRGEFEETRFHVLDVTQTCIACHSRLPSQGDFAMAERLTANVEVSKLERRALANLQFATRQFGAALDTWEAAFQDESVGPNELFLTGEIVDYLIVGLRVERNPERVAGGLGLLAARPDTPRYLRQRVSAWSASIQELGDIWTAAPDLAKARSLALHASAEPGLSVSAERQVYDLAASSLLERLVTGVPEPGPELAEAYYLLGSIQLRTSGSYWVQTADFHLETAVRIDPHGPFAEPAYVLLEEKTVLDYGGTTERWVPSYVRNRLAELRRLLDEQVTTAER